MMSGTTRTRQYAGAEVCWVGSRDLCSHARRELPDRPKVWQRIGLSTLIRSTRAFTRPDWEDRMRRRRIRSVGVLVVGASLLLSGACSGHSAPSPTTTPPVSTAEQVTSVAVSAPSTVPSTSVPPSTTPASTTSGPTQPSATTSKSTTASPTTVTPAQRFPWTVDYKLVPKTAPVLAVIKDAMPVYQAYMATYDQSLQAPKSRNWEPVMKAFATDRGLSVWERAWQGNAELGIVQKGDRSAAGLVVGAGPDVVVLRACMDVTHVKAVDPAGNVLPLAKGISTKGFAWLLTIQRGGDGHMRVVELLTQTLSGKDLSC